MIASIPETLEEAIGVIIGSMDTVDRAYVLDRENDAAGAHFGGGMAMRNQWGLWHDSVLARHFKTRFGLGHADDMSAIILDSVYAQVRGEVFDVEAAVARSKAHWLNLGVDPLTQEKIGSDAPREKNAGGIDWSGFDIAGAAIRRQPAQKSFWDKLGDAIFGPR